MVLPFSLFMLGLVRNQEREEANIAATQNSPPLDLLGEIWGGGFALLLGGKRQKEEKYYKKKTNIGKNWETQEAGVFCIF